MSSNLLFIRYKKSEGIPEGGSFLFNGRRLTEPGHYTTVYPSPACDSVVALTLYHIMGVPEPFSDHEQVLYVEVFSILGQPLGRTRRPDEVTELDLKPGTYILQIHTTEGVRNKKIVIE